jgi:hypothetical protein
VVPDLSMRELITVEIAGGDGRILQVAPKSALPFVVTSESTWPAFMAVNVQWRFTTADQKFSTSRAKYRTTKADATISFTKDGVKLDGIEERPK